MSDLAPSIRAALADPYTPKEIDLWLASPHPQLDDRAANDLIAEGRAGEVVAVMRRLEDCVYL